MKNFVVQQPSRHFGWFHKSIRQRKICSNESTKLTANIFIILVAVLVLYMAITSMMSKPKWQWFNGSEHVFRYEGRLLTGIPQLASYFSGLAIQCDVVIQKEKEIEDQTLVHKMFIRHPMFIDINKQVKLKSQFKMNISVQFNWQNTYLPSLIDVPFPIKEQIKKPIEFIVKQPEGYIQKIFISPDEPTWSINFKKALVTLFQIKMEMHSIVDNEKRKFQESTKFEGSYWKTTEESIDGICETSYQINQIPEYMVKEEPVLIPYPQACRQSKYYEIIKVKDIESCQNKPVFLFHKSKNIKSLILQKSSQIRYLACGSLDKLVLQKIINEAEIRHDLIGPKLENVMTGISQTLVLKAVQSIQKQALMPVTKAPYNLRYEIPHLKSSELNELKFVPMPADHNNASTVLPRNMLCPEDALNYQSREHFLHEVYNIIINIVREMIQEVELSRSMLADYILSAQRGISLLNLNEIKMIYQYLKKISKQTFKQTAKDVFCDLVSMTGTFPSTKFILEIIKIPNEISLLKKISILMTLPAYIITPTHELLEYYFSIVTSKSALSQPNLYKIGILGLTNLIQKACLNENKMTAYPSQIYEEFCNEQSPIVTQKVLPYLTKRLQSSISSDKLIYIVALGSLSHELMVPILIPFIENTSYSTKLRTVSIYSLAKTGKRFPLKIIPFVYSIFSKPSEATEVRIAALELLKQFDLPMSIINQIGTSTYFENNPEVFNAVIKMFRSLAEINDANPPITIRANLSKKVSLVKYLLSKVPTYFGPNEKYFSPIYLNKLGIGYETITSIIGNSKSLIPKQIYKKISYVTDSTIFSPLEVALTLNGLESLYQQLQVIDKNKEPHSNSDAEGDATSELTDTINKHNNSLENPDEFNIYLCAQFFEHYNIISRFNKMDISSVMQIVQLYIKNPSQIKQKLCGKNSFNFQQIFNIMPAEILIPTEMGFPISILTSSLFTLSIKGELNIKCSPSFLPSVYLSTVIKVYTGIVGRISTYSPFSKRILTTGIDQSAIVSIPFRTDISLDVKQGKLDLKLLPPSIPQPTNLFFYSVTPFITSNSFINFNPRNRNIKLIRKGYKPKWRSFQAHGKFIGLELNSLFKTETKIQSKTYDLYKLLSLFNYNPLSPFKFGPSVPSFSKDSYPSIQHHSYQFQYDPQRSRTKKLILSIDFGLSTKYDNFPPTYHKFQVKTLAQMEETKFSINGLIPWTITSEPLSQKRSHPERQISIEEMFDQLQVQSGLGIYMKYLLVLKGKSPTTYAKRVTLAFGSKQMSTLWNIKIENVSSSPTANVLCSRGELIHPNIALWNLESLQDKPINWKFNNLIGFGEMCTDSRIVISGNSRVTEEKSQQIKTSDISINCKNMLKRGVLGAQFLYPCIQARILAQRLNYLNVTIEYKNIPHFLAVLDEKTMQLVKLLGWPYLSNISEFNAVQNLPKSFDTTFNFLLDEDTRTVNVYIQRPNESLNYRNIHYVYPIDELLPPISLIRNSISSYLYEPTCELDKSSIRTFENKALRLHLDNCFHLVAADCSQQNYFGVFVKHQNTIHNKTIEAKLLVSRHTILLKTILTEVGYQKIKIYLEHDVFEAPTDSVKNIVTETGDIIANMKLTVDGVLIINLRRYASIYFNGEFLQIKVNQFIKNKLCGMCGNFNSVTPEHVKYTYSSRSLEITGYKVQPENCNKLQMNSEENIYPQEKLIKTTTKLNWIENNLTQSNNCYHHQHIIVEHADEVCYSKILLLKCIEVNCHASQMIEKKVAFVCIPSFKANFTLHYKKKILNGAFLKELQNIPTSYETQVMLPKTCEP